MDRSQFFGGPAFFTHNGVSWQFVEDSWEAGHEIKTIELKSNIQGLIGKREDYSVSTVKGQPIAFLSSMASQFAKLFAFQPSQMGALLFPAVDLPGVIQTKQGGSLGTGQSITFSAMALSQPPTLQFAATKPLFASAGEWMGLRKNNTPASATNAHVVVVDSAWAEPTLDPTNIIDTTYTVSWGAVAPFNAIECDPEGVKLETRYEWEELGTANDGVLNFRLKNVTSVVRFVPMNVDADDFHDVMLLMDGASAGRGKIMAARGQTFTVEGAGAGDPLLTISKAVPVSGATRHGGTSRIGEVVLEAHRHYSGGTLQPLFSLGEVV